ncbi:ABC transporter ATP-binding protein [Sporichthya polymorpha]|uniref:ABC transporter ATP-binding protein n=1 Tax=Sporichthya polymorpha TaxID=35751 RepID=UPI00039B0FE2|nr:ABC transporter ATP-binding protein [Sporichthya polymorpha]
MTGGMTVDLDVQNVTVRFGGIVAVNDATLYAKGGQITGLIGPNGAGKTTFFNACTGRNHPQSGTVRLGGKDLHGHRSSHRAHRGLGRTFQRMELFESLTVVENVRTGPAAYFSSFRPLGLMYSTRKETKEINARAAEAMAHCGIEHLSNKVVGDLSTGQRRLVELARAIATPFKFLLLDEPSSGLDVSETHAFGKVLTDWVAETGNGILIVEHDMALVAEICEFIYVLDFGKIIYSGPTQEALRSDIVRAAYLGEVSVA